MAKRILSVVLAVLLVFTFVSCGKEEKQEGKKTKTYEQISCLADKETTNATIIDIYGKADVSAIPVHI